MKTNIRVLALLILLFVIKGVAAQSPTDGVDSLLFTTPLIDYAIPTGDLTIADIQVVGSETYEDYVLIGF